MRVVSVAVAFVMAGAVGGVALAGGSGLPMAEGAAHAPVQVLKLAQADTAPAADAAAPAGEVDEEMLAAMMTEGETVYQDFCSACHGTTGRGDVGPALVGNGRLEDGEFVYRQIAQGGSEMPGFDGVLSEEEILAVGHYVRNSWGNEYGPLTAETAGLDAAE